MQLRDEIRDLSHRRLIHMDSIGRVHGRDTMRVEYTQMIHLRGDSMYDNKMSERAQDEWWVGIRRRCSENLKDLLQGYALKPVPGICPMRGVLIVERRDPFAGVLGLPQCCFTWKCKVKLGRMKRRGESEENAVTTVV